MSRSRRKNPMTGWTNARTEKDDKRLAHRKFRQREREAIHRGEDPPEDLKEVSDIWDFDKDGKQIFDPEKYPELMRK